MIGSLGEDAPGGEEQDRREAGPPAARDVSSGAWKRAAGLFVVALALSTMEPLVLIGLPYIMLVLFLPSSRLPALLAGGIAAFLVFGGAGSQGLWYAERGWAVLVGGWYVVLTLSWPRSAFTSRALGAVGGSALVTALVVAVQPGSWAVLDWLISDRIREGVGTALEAFRLLQGEESVVSPALVTAVYETAELQVEVFPAMLALASMASLGVAWWMYVRLASGVDGGLEAMRDFRFNDQLVWVFIAGLFLLLVGGGDPWSRAGSNAVVFMGALYVLRGAAVVTFFSGGLTFLGFVLLVIGLLFIAPVLLAGALVIGLGDTWLDLRDRAQELMA